MAYDGRIMRQALARFEEDKQRRSTRTAGTGSAPRRRAEAISLGMVARSCCSISFKRGSAS